MIPIKLQNNNLEWYKDKVIKMTSNLRNGSKNNNKDDFVCCMNYFSNVLIEDADLELSSFEEFLVFDLEKLVKIKQTLENKYHYSDINSKFKVLVRAYSNFSKNDVNNAIIEKTGVTVCPYCNRNFVNSPNNHAVAAELDHFWDKDNNSIFALCFYNLIPICPTCNRIKTTKTLIRSPYDKKRINDVTFSFLIKGADYLYNKDALKIVIDDKTSEDDVNQESDLDKLLIPNAYEIHNDYVQELIKKYLLYSDDRIDELLRNHSNLFRDKKEMYRILFGNYTTEEENGKRPLSKLTTDILTELEMLMG